MTDAESVVMGVASVLIAMVRYAEVEGMRSVIPASLGTLLVVLLKAAESQNSSGIQLVMVSS